MFLSIPDSVMNSHILRRDVLLQNQTSAGVSLLFNRCLTRFKHFAALSNLFFSCEKSLRSVSQECEVDVFEHPRFCDELSHLVKGCFVANSTLCWSVHSI